MLFWARLQATRILVKLPAKRIFTKKCRIAYFQSKTQKRLCLQRTANFALFTPAKHNVILDNLTEND